MIFLIFIPLFFLVINTYNNNNNHTIDFKLQELDSCDYDENW